MVLMQWHHSSSVGDQFNIDLIVDCKEDGRCVCSRAKQKEYMCSL